MTRSSTTAPPGPTVERRQVAYVIRTMRTTLLRRATGGTRTTRSAERRVLEHRRSADECPEHPSVADRPGLRCEQVAIDHGQVRELADRDRAGLRVEVVHPRRAGGECADPFGQVQRLVGQERLAASPRTPPATPERGPPVEQP